MHACGRKLSKCRSRKAVLLILQAIYSTAGFGIRQNPHISTFSSLSFAPADSPLSKHKGKARILLEKKQKAIKIEVYAL
jgi:hypothetical protein